jgi:type IV secretory pathway VirJ component
MSVLRQSAESMALYKHRTKLMKVRLVGAVLGIASLPVAANAQLTINMASITCSQYLGMPPAQSRDFSAWMSGWFSYQLNKTTIDLATHEKNISNVKAWCQYHPQETVMSGLKNSTGQ